MARPRQEHTKPRQTVAKQTLIFWQKNKKQYDVENLMALAKKKKLPHTKPSITTAILYGYCPNPKLEGLITEYYINEVTKEKEKLALIKGL